MQNTCISVVAETDDDPDQHMSTSVNPTRLEALEADIIASLSFVPSRDLRSALYEQSRLAQLDVSCNSTPAPSRLGWRPPLHVPCSGGRCRSNLRSSV